MVNDVKNRGFTIIELLVVISMVGILSAVIITNLSSARDKGVDASAKYFAAHNAHVFSADAVGIWNFDEPAGTNNVNDVNDLTGNGRNLQPDGNGGNLSRSLTTPNLIGSSFDIDNSNGARYATTETLQVSKQVLLSEVTVSVWVNFDTHISSGVQNNVLIGALASPNSVSPIIMYATSNGIIHCRSGMLNNNDEITFTGVKLDTWHHLACSANATTGKLTGFLDGKMANSKTLSVGVERTVTEIVVGAGGGSGYSSRPYFNGFIDDPAVYSHALMASDIQHIYAGGLSNHTLATQ